MTAFNTCVNKDVFSTVLQIALSLIDDVDTLAVTRAFSGIRTTRKTISRAPELKITCATKEDFENLLRMALGVGTDNIVTLNVIVGDKLDGAGLNRMQCGHNENIWERLARCFVNTDDGEVAVYIANLTT